jgi:hypothetical protein
MRLAGKIPAAQTASRDFGSPYQSEDLDLDVDQFGSRRNAIARP